MQDAQVGDRDLSIGLVPMRISLPIMNVAGWGVEGEVVGQGEVDPVDRGQLREGDREAPPVTRSLDNGGKKEWPI